MQKKLLSLLSIPVLAGCAYTVDTAVQDITILTPGAEDAVCMLDVDNVKYRIHPPQTTSISRTEADLIVDCLAPGNRRKKVVIEPAIAQSAAGNVVTAGAGLVWDYASGALFQYPDVVEVSFINTPIGPAFIPAQNNPDIKQPEEYRLEEFRPSQPRMNEDRDAIPTEFKRRGSQSPSSAAAYETESFSEPETISGGKGDLKTTVESYGDALNPSADSGPTPIIPGE